MVDVRAPGRAPLQRTDSHATAAASRRPCSRCHDDAYNHYNHYGHDSLAGLSDHDNYHEFCKLLGRLKTNYQLSELVSVDNYGKDGLE